MPYFPFEIVYVFSYYLKRMFIL